MNKQTFDQVSAVMWGRNALDYHINYIVPRAQWEDSDIREEAIYFAGMAHGLRLGASQKSDQPMMHNQGQPSVFHGGNSYQPSNNQRGHPTLGEHGSFGAASEPQIPRQLRPIPHPGSVLSPGVQTTSNPNRIPWPQNHLSNVYGPAPPHNGFASYSRKGFGAYGEPGCDEWPAPFRSNFGAHIHATAAMLSQVGGDNTENRGNQLQVQPVHGGMQPSNPYAVGQASHFHTGLHTQHPEPLSPIPARDQDSARSVTVEDHPEEISEEDHARVDTPSTNESMDNWFEEQGAQVI